MYLQDEIVRSGSGVCPGIAAAREAKRTGAVPAGISFASVARARPMRAQMTASCSGVRPDGVCEVDIDIRCFLYNDCNVTVHE